MIQSHTTSQRHNWTTPAAFFKRLDLAFRFTLDAAATDETALCREYFTPETDALQQRWPGRVWLNPPYDKHQQAFIQRAIKMVTAGVSELVVVLLPARPETRLWQYLIFPNAQYVVWVRGRLAFDGARYNNAPFPSAVLVFTSRELSEGELATLVATGFVHRVRGPITVIEAPADISPRQATLFAEEALAG